MQQLVPLRLALIDVSNDFTVVGVGVAHNMIQLPIGLMGISSYLKANLTAQQLDLRIIDAALDAPDYDALLAMLRQYEPQVVGIRALSHTNHQFHELAGRIKRWRSTVLVVGGGPYAAASPDLIIEDTNFDVVCRGEGEQVMLELLQVLLQDPRSRDFALIQGITYRTAPSDSCSGGAIQRNPDRAFFTDLDALPVPDYRAIELHRYSTRHAFTSILRPYGILVTSRGCPFHCVYCHSLFGKRFRGRSPSSVIEEIRYVHREFGLANFMIIDDVFNFDLPRAKEILRGLVSLQLDLRLFFPNGLRGDIIDEEFLDLLVEAGTVELVFAIESATARIQKLIRKKIDLDRVERSLISAAQREMVVNAFFMIGFPTETLEEVDRTVDMAIRLIDHIHFPYVGIVRAYHGSALYQIALDHGYSEKWLLKHALMPYGTQESIRYEYNFLPNDQLQKARTRLALAFRNEARTERLLAIQRRLFTEEELVVKYATCFGSTIRIAELFLQQFPR